MRYSVLYIFSGIAAGLAASLLGLGLALILVPLLVLRANFSYQLAIKITGIVTLVATLFALGTEFFSGAIPYYIGFITGFGTIIGSFFGVITRKYLTPVLIAKASFFVSFLLGLSMLIVVLINSF